MQDISTEILKPARYINREWNAVYKEWREETLKVALCFPDIYEIGMSHLGMRIIYGILNQEKGVVCERVFAPWRDMEARMRSRKEGLLSLEGSKGLKEFDIIGFSLQYEMSFVDVLNILDLGQVPIFSSQRGDGDPVVIAGGPCCFNPAPMADFIDAFVIGEGEEVIREIAGAARRSMPDAGGSRGEVLEGLSKIKGVYVPAAGIGHPISSVEKRVVKDMDSSYFPLSPIVPNIQVVHDRIGVEIMRGCPHRCRFCQACRIFNPLRIRSVKRILEIAEESIKNTGYEEMSLLSLSTGDYPYLEELVGKLEERFKGMGVRISLPSLRVRSLNGSEINGIVKRKGLTFAPEAGSDRLRKYLNKGMENEEIIRKSGLALKSGWRKVKLYFMVGLPGERYEDLDAIIQLASQIKSVNLSISPFIPKPHTEFEREGMDELETLKDKKEYLKRSSLKIDFHRPEMCRIEAVLSRGDRKLGEVIHRAWQKGARLQAWGEHFDYNLWKACLEECGVDPQSYLSRMHKEDSLPWAFIDMDGRG